MDTMALADLLFPESLLTPNDYEKIYPPRNLPPGAAVTRLGPSPTGFMHLGNLYSALVDERLAHQSAGVFFLRIEDTDDKRRVDGAVETILSALDYFDVHFDEGATAYGETGAYGPYRQSQRGPIYQCFAKHLVASGQAYPCFCTEAELAAIRTEQENTNVATGYYGEWARHRDLSLTEVKDRLSRQEPFVIRLRAQGVSGRTFSITDAIRGKLTITENVQDIVLLKTSGLPTYHFAHVVDDHLMRTTHVVRGEEWLSTLPIHAALFQALGWSLPIYCHTAHLLKLDNGAKRKLSKRKDPESGLDYYRLLGYHPLAVKTYLLALLNSNYEEWAKNYPAAELEDFAFTLSKMSRSGALFDLDKLNDTSKDVLLKLSVSEIYDFLVSWACSYRPDLSKLLVEHQTDLLKLLSIGRSDEKPRKDLIYAGQIIEFISYFFAELFVQTDPYPAQMTSDDCRELLAAYLENFFIDDDGDEWLNKLQRLALQEGYAASKSDYKNNPDQYKGHIGDVSAVLRIALVGRRHSPDLWSLQQVMGLSRIKQRLSDAINTLVAH